MIPLLLPLPFSSVCKSEIDATDIAYYYMPCRMPNAEGSKTCMINSSVIDTVDLKLLIFEIDATDIAYYFFEAICHTEKVNYLYHK